MSLTKADLIDSIYKNLDLSKRRSTAVIESLLDIMKDTLESGEDMLISGFGKFCVKDKSERRGRNPQTGAKIKIKAKKVPKFIPGKALKDAVS